MEERHRICISARLLDIGDGIIQVGTSHDMCGFRYLSSKSKTHLYTCWDLDDQVWVVLAMDLVQT